MSLNPPYDRNEKLNDIYQGNSVIKYGDKGDHVSLVQQGLMQWQPNCLPKYGADGSWGNEGTQACKKFQTTYGLVDDGIFGKASLTVLSERFNGWVPKVDPGDPNIQIRGLHLAERQLDSVGVPNAKFGTKVISKNGVTIRVTSMGKDPNKSYGWVSDGKCQFKATNPDMEICKLTVDIESEGTYDTVNAYDSAGLSIGPFHDTFHTGNAQRIMKKFRELNPDSFLFFFRDVFSDIVKLEGNYVMLGIDKKVIDLKELRSIFYVKAIVDSCYCSAMQRAMDFRMMEWLDSIRRNTCIPFGFKSRRADALILSLSVNLGEGGCRSYVRHVDPGNDEYERLIQLRELVINGNEEHGLEPRPGKEARIDHVLNNTKGSEWD